jgi:hypothetical protein
MVYGRSMVSGEGTVIRELAIVDSDDVIVLLDPEDRPEGIEPWHPFPNILRTTHTGEVVWRCALLPQETTWKCYLSVEWVGDGKLIAHAPSYRVTLDPASGAIIDSVFLK